MKIKITTSAHLGFHEENNYTINKHRDEKGSENFSKQKIFFKKSSL